MVRAILIANCIGRNLLTLGIGAAVVIGLSAQLAPQKVGMVSSVEFDPGYTVKKGAIPPSATVTIANGLEDANHTFTAVGASTKIIVTLDATNQHATITGPAGTFPADDLAPEIKALNTAARQLGVKVSKTYQMAQTGVVK